MISTLETYCSWFCSGAHSQTSGHTHQSQFDCDVTKNTYTVRTFLLPVPSFPPVLHCPSLYILTPFCGLLPLPPLFLSPSSLPPPPSLPSLPTLPPLPSLPSLSLPYLPLSLLLPRPFLHFPSLFLPLFPSSLPPSPPSPHLRFSLSA